MSENEEQKVPKFSPTRAMLKVLKATLEPETKPTITDMCKKAGVTRRQWYKWKKKEGFEEWFNESFIKALGNEEWWFDKVGMQKGVKDYRYWEAMQMKHFKFNRKEGGEGVTINFLDQLDDYEKGRRFPPEEDTESKEEGKEPQK